MILCSFSSETKESEVVQMSIALQLSFSDFDPPTVLSYSLLFLLEGSDRGSLFSPANWVLVCKFLVYNLHAYRFVINFPCRSVVVRFAKSPDICHGEYYIM